MAPRQPANFDLDTVALSAKDSMRRGPGHTDRTGHTRKSSLAARIFGTAAHGERDPQRLLDAALGETAA